MKWQMKCTSSSSPRLRKRTGPSTSYKIVGYIYPGQTVIVVDSRKSGSSTWYKIEGTSHWSCGKSSKGTEYLKFEKDLDPPKPPNPPPDPPKPTPPPEPPYVPPTYETGGKDANWVNTPYDDDWYVKPTYGTLNGKIPTDQELELEYRRIRYNMDISYVSRQDMYQPSNGYFTSLQKKIHSSFNRNKTCFPDYHLNKTFAYVFFTRPDLNICKMKDKWTLTDQASKDPKYNYIFKNNPLTLRSLVKDGNPYHKFLVLLSNEAKSFEVSDVVLKTVEHGETFTGNKIIYGKNDYESNSAGEISIRYVDGVNLDIFKLHTIWTDYISRVNKGIFAPDRKYIQSKILDYACSCYYILCGPDGSTILYWQKLTGVFPVNTGENAFSWDSGTLLAKPELNIKYMYSMKTPMDVSQLYEINELVHLKTSKPKFKNIYSKDNCATGSTLTHSPYIVPSEIGGQEVFRLMWVDNE